MLASLLFPYDDDVPGLIEGWLGELEREECIRRYRVDKDDYLEITNWLEHQKIDKPSASKHPAFDEGSRTFSNVREQSSEDQGPGPRTKERTKDQVSSSVAIAPDPERSTTDEAIRLWNELATELGFAKVQRMTTARERALTARLRDGGSIGGWIVALGKIRASDYLCGRVERAKGHENWRPNFDWLVTERGFTRLMEGNHDNGNPNYRNGFAAILAEAEQRASGRDLGKPAQLEATPIDGG